MAQNVYQKIWPTFVRKFVTIKLKKSPNLVTQMIDTIGDICLP